MAASDAILLTAVCVLAAIAIGAGVLVGRRLSRASQAYSSGLCIAAAGYLLLLAFYSAVAAASFDGLCYPLLQAPQRCSILEHLRQALTLIAVGTAPLLPALFAISTIASLMTMRFCRGKGEATSEKVRA